ncbi:hypothetical protein ACTMTJ_27085 [Phytohabitans sp. LJ34]|uniref:hypothetical protein n=1 Tax=Phytohabitans sp. LJ34 TaxID=3452217 RepID=UPI003F8B4B75
MRAPGGQASLRIHLRGFDPGGTAMSPDEAVRGFLEALEVPAARIPVTLAAQAGLYRSLLADRRALVVLDNARDPEQVRPLLPAARGCAVVVTSRDQLTGLVSVDGAHPIALEVMNTAESRQVLARRIDGAGWPPSRTRSSRSSGPAPACRSHCPSWPPAPRPARGSRSPRSRPSCTTPATAWTRWPAATRRRTSARCSPGPTGRWTPGRPDSSACSAPPPAGVAPEPLTDYAGAMAWCAAERATLVALICQPHHEDRYRWRLAWTIANFLDRRGLWHDLAAGDLGAARDSMRGAVDILDELGHPDADVARGRLRELL